MVGMGWWFGMVRIGGLIGVGGACGGHRGGAGVNKRGEGSVRKGVAVVHRLLGHVTGHKLLSTSAGCPRCVMVWEAHLGKTRPGQLILSFH